MFVSFKIFPQVPYFQNTPSSKIRSSDLLILLILAASAARFGRHFIGDKSSLLWFHSRTGHSLAGSARRGRQRLADLIADESAVVPPILVIVVRVGRCPRRSGDGSFAAVDIVCWILRILAVRLSAVRVLVVWAIGVRVICTGEVGGHRRRVIVSAWSSSLGQHPGRCTWRRNGWPV